jgi:3-oxoacyl-[acyl-carrier-protein] synthase I
MRSQRPVFLAALGIASALGAEKRSILQNLVLGRRPGVVERRDLLIDGEPVHVGAVQHRLPETPAEFGRFESRNTQLIICALQQIRSAIDEAVERFGRHRIGTVMGTSTSGIAEGEAAIAHLVETGVMPESFDVRQQELGTASEFVASYLSLEGPAYTVSTACSSSAHALASGQRMLNSGLADVVIAGGADSLCRLTVNGFRALSALSDSYCNPFSRNRDGTMIGEGVAVFLMQRDPSAIALYGSGASTDAHSMTAPDPSGCGVELAVRQALRNAGITPADINYIQLHGTGTQQNDAMESALVRRLFGDQTPCSSSKGQVGHTLGAAGAMGAAHCWLAASDLNVDRLLPPHVWDGKAEDGLLSEALVRPGQKLETSGQAMFLSNSFAFGGSNVSLVIGRSEQ